MCGVDPIYEDVNLSEAHRANDFAALAAKEDVEVACALMGESPGTAQAIINQEAGSGHVDMDAADLLRLQGCLMPSLHIIAWAHM